ncbi:ricin-type beta-trefoil lectin domain protein [Sanguibacter sp. 4.1]|uniref:Ricin-type beta-trefoil lectin domain protein n=1 Tax=Sanguibacter biliveldensis TaxID=3030830 RepID=A0AAF1C440_9MICO|nr:ricin-type beta-trefoil lectin domain protein [Sanguibacter sp. 4.1]WPF83704.1 ricin-type beta-trefoil lectin domain protein [Sanguibacter sp. 4.1]
MVAGDYWYTNSPSGQALCLDVTGGVNAATGASLSTYACHSQTTSAYWNQQLTMVDVGGEYAVLTMRAPAGLVLQATGSRVTVEARVVGAVTQRWSTQWLATNTFRYVNLGTGMCLTAPSSAGALTMSTCTGTANQAFVLRGVGSVAAQDPVTDSVATDALAVPGTSDGRALHDPSSSEPAESASAPAAPGPVETTEDTSPSDARVADEGLVDGTEGDDEPAQVDTSGPSASPATRYGPDLTEGVTGD